MSAAFPSANIEVNSGSTANALSLCLARKRYSSDERERIKKRRKQLNPVRLPVDHGPGPPLPPQPDVEYSDTDSDKHITYPPYHVENALPYRTDELITTFKTEPETTGEPDPSTTYKTEPENLAIKTEPLSPVTPKIENLDPVPLNLTKNSRVDDILPKTEIKTEPPIRLYSPRKDDTTAGSLKSESPNYEHFATNNAFVDDKKDRSPPFSPRTPPASVMRNLFPTRTSSCRIFNPEAFCNICNKEFCNKYFLKTHKANKHGVYCENKDSFTDVELPAIPLMFTWNVKNNVKIPSNPLLFNSNAAKDSSAFCNICEKEFCNKYFLRRHKEKMHGIVPFSESRKSETESEKSEQDDTERTAILEDMKPWPECRPNELNQTAKPDKSKLPKCSSNATDAVSDFIKIYLAAGKATVPERSNGETQLFDYKRNGANVDFDNLSKSEVHRYEDVKCTTTTGEFGVQAKDEDFSDSLHQNRNVYQPDDEGLTRGTCEFCRKSFSTAAITRLHQKYVHALTTDDTEKDELDFKHMENVYFMILKFSWLNTAVTYCEICKTEFEKNDVLEMHLMNKHGTLVDELSRIIEDANVNGLSAPGLNVGDGNIICQICNKTFSTNAAFQQHAYEKCNFPEFKDYAEYQSIDDTDSSKSTRNFCEICKKELCNKYFMKTHMRRMHGIAIQNGVRIGGVTCEICNKELCSKYFLRVHKKNCHGIMENVQFARLLLQQDCERTDELQSKYAASQVCVICGRIFKSIKWLKTHLFSDHGKLGASLWQEMLTGYSVDGFGEPAEGGAEATTTTSNDDEKALSQLYQCSSCHFQASSVDVLLTHQRLHIKPADHLPYRCPYCFLVCKDKISLEEHIAYHHFGAAELTDKHELMGRYHVGGRDSENVDMKKSPSSRNIEHVNT